MGVGPLAVVVYGGREGVGCGWGTKAGVEEGGGGGWGGNQSVNELQIGIVQELCESRGGRPGLSVLTSLLVSVDVKLY